MSATAAEEPRNIERTQMEQLKNDEEGSLKVDVTQRDVVRRRLPSNTVERDEQDELEELGGKEFQEIHMNFEEKPKTAPQGNRENAVAHTLPRRAPSRRAKPAQSKSPRRAPSKKGSLARKRKSSKVKARNIASKKKAGSKSVIETKKANELFNELYGPTLDMQTGRAPTPKSPASSKENDKKTKTSSKSKICKKK
ncbi:hypothetical protein Q1695_004066 [Nippostrongylus brasiliensis]|nr:hypothetical protein Q1695_004066 [Nippostrongylus brasiliensis]